MTVNRFTIGQAWSHATGFFSGGAANFAIILIGIGVLAPAVLQWAVMGNAMTNAFNPAMMASGGMMAAGVGITAMVVSLVVYVLQFGSYFAAWRLGLASDANDLPDALRYGGIVGGVFVGLMIAAIAVMAILAYAITPWLALPLVLLFLLFFVVIYPALFGFLAIMMVLAAAFGGYALTSAAPIFDGAAGGGIALLIMLLAGVLFLWLAARLCCTAPSMVEQHEYLPFQATKRSWALTAEGQWRIVGYLLLIGVVLFVLALILGLLIGTGFQSMIMGGGGPGFGMIILVTLLVSIPAAYFTVAIPAGIYRTVGVQNADEVFA
jgi:hypothetical protein